MAKVDSEKLRSLAKFIVEELSESEKKQLKSLLEAEELSVPVSIFKNNLSALELSVRYLKDVKKLSFKEISKLLGRKYSTLTTTYYNSVSKLKKLKYEKSRFFIPVSVLKKSKLSILESIVSYLSVEHKLPTKQIAQLLERSYETVKTVKRRCKQKA